MRKKSKPAIALLAAMTVVVATAVAAERIDHPIDTPLYTLRGPETATVSVIQTDVEIEYIGDYLELDQDRAESALRLLGHVDFTESMLLIVNGGPVEGAMLRVGSIYEEDAVLHVVIETADPPAQQGDSDFASPASNIYTPSLVTVLPRFQGVLVVHAYPADWAASGDLRGIQLLVTWEDESGAGDASPDADEDDRSDDTGSN